MFTYQCLNCGKEHRKLEPFGQDFETKCLRCAHSFRVTRETIKVSDDKDSRSDLGILAPLPGGMGQLSHQEGGEESRNNHAITLDRPETRGEQSIALTASDTALKQDRSDGGDEPDVVTARSKGKSKSRGKRSANTNEAALDSIDAEGESEEKEEADSGMGGKSKKEKEPAKKSAEKTPWLMIAGIVVPTLLVLGGAGYLLFGGKKAPARNNKPVAKGNPPAVAATPPPPRKVEEKKVEPKVPTGPPTPDFLLSAPRLAFELASDPTATDRKYLGTCIEVSGLFDKLETEKGPNAVPLTSALFRLDRGSVRCQLGNLLPADLIRWQSLRGDQLFNVRGTYGKGGVLTKCYLMEPRAVADAKWGGKTIELKGVIDTVLLPDTSVEFPTLRFEGETNTPVTIECLFKKTDLDALKQISAGSSVILKGVCGNGRSEATRTVVPIHNCEIITTTAPAPSVPRLVPADLARDFGEDSRPYFLPPRGKEEKVETPLTVTKLSQEWKARSKNLDKYLLRLLTVSGRLKSKANGMLILESTETDQIFKVSCRFRKEIFRELADIADFTVVGLCTGMEGSQTLRLDNCVVDASQMRKTVPRVTADYLPHKPGRTVIYDLATYPPAVKLAVIERQMWYQGAGGLTETVITRTARFLGVSLFSPDKAESWPAKGAKKTNLKGPVYSQKNSAGMIEFGQRIMLPKGVQVVQEPILKLGVKAGDSWEWVQENSKHTYTLERFDKWLARSCVIVKEVIVSPLDRYPEREVRHVYVLGVGEVERQTWLVITSKDKKLVQEKKMVFVDEGRAGPGLPTSKKP